MRVNVYLNKRGMKDYLVNVRDIDALAEELNLTDLEADDIERRMDKGLSVEIGPYILRNR